ncbi:MAG: leucine-rich repeat domain-containing protein [Clostridia bacterium]|nr:leucine-rich repeat domain-containing protein [Clostridia bacterium]
MKKKILILAIMIVALMSIFVISASAAETTVEKTGFVNNAIYKSSTNEFGTVNKVTDTSTIYCDSSLDESARMVMKNADGSYSTYPTLYIMTTVTDGQGARYTFDKLNALVGEEYDINSIARIEFPEGYEKPIRGSSFKGSTELVYVKIASTVPKINGNAFQNCTNLSTVEFGFNYEKYPENGSNFTTLGNGAVFNGCSSLTSLIFPNSLTHIDNSTFGGCTNLTVLNLGANFNSVNQVPAIPSSVLTLVISDTYCMDAKLFAWDTNKFTRPTSLVIYYTGTLEQANTLQSTNVSCWEISHSTLVSYDEFTDEEFVRDETVHYLVYDYNKCDAFYKGVHNYKGDGDCTHGVTCTQCNDNISSFIGHVYAETLVYPNGFKAEGVYNKYCQNASDCKVGLVENEEKKPVFTALADNGYSTNGNGIAFGGFVVNTTELKKYNDLNENDITFGIFVANPKYLGDTFMENGEVNATSGFLKVDMTSDEYTNIKIMLDGFTGSAQNLELVISLYAYTDVSDVEYIQSEHTACANSNVVKSDATLYTVTLSSVENKPYKDNLEALPVYGKEQIA